MDLALNNKTALVTGSTAGIGLAIAQALAAEGATVVVNGRSRERVDQAVAQLKTIAKAPVYGVAADLATQAGFETLIKAMPTADIVINNLGIFEPKPFEQITDDDWRRFFEVNVLSGVRISRYYLPLMLKQNWGRMIFISSESGIQTPVEMIHYGMTKTAQLAVSRGLAETTAGTAVTVNSVLPGPTASEGVATFVEQLAAASNVTPAEFEKQFFATVRPSSLIKRFATTEEVAALVAFVSSPQASAINGAALRVDGGTVRSII